MEFEGVPEDQDEDEYESLIMDLKFSDNDKEEDPEFDQFITGFGKVNGATTVALLNDQSAQHAITRTDPSDQSTYITEGRYSSTTFQGIMVDTGAARWSTAGQDQFYALQKVQDVKLDKTRAGQAKIHFGIGVTTSIGTADVDTPLGTITFHVVPANTPFLFCLYDMDNLKVKFDNLENVLVQGNKKIPVIRKYGHPFMLLERFEATLVQNYTVDIAKCHLTDTELR